MSKYETFAILISVISITIAVFALGWNVYRDIILKPRLRVRLSIGRFMGPMHKSPDKIVIEATNFGPNKVKCVGIPIRNATLLGKLFRTNQYGFLVSDYTDACNTKMPCQLDVGDSCNLVFPFERNCFLAEPCTHVGISDGFGRKHWVPKKDILEAQKEYKKRFG
jgi:hypothetical protein